MDSLTHLVAGALTPLAFRGTPKRAAVLAFGIVAGELPDVDVFFGGDVESLLTMHRSVTHALLWQPILALLVVLPFYIWMQYRPQEQLTLPEETGKAARGRGSRRGRVLTDGFRFETMWAAALVACCMHVYLDSMTTFGTQALLPFSPARVWFPAMFIVDLFLTVPAMALCVWAWKQRPEIVLTPESPGFGRAVFSGKARRIALFGLAWILLYPMASLGAHSIALAVFTPRLTGGPESGQKLILLTAPFSPFFWKAVIEEEDHYRIGTVQTLAPDRVGTFRTYAKPDRTLFDKLKKQVPLFVDFENFGPILVRLERPAAPHSRWEKTGTATEYAFVDVRYILTDNPVARFLEQADANFILEARVNDSGALLAWRFLQRGRDGETTPWIMLQ